MISNEVGLFLLALMFMAPAASGLALRAYLRSKGYERK